MKKIVCLILSVLMLSSCTVKTSIDLQSELESSLASANEVKIFTSNINKPLYSYYLPPSIGRNKSTQTSSVLNDRGRKFVMNLNVASIIQEKYYSETEQMQTNDFQDPIAQCEGEYIDVDETTHSYTVSTYDMSGYYVTVFHSDVVEFYSVLDALSTCDIVKDMLRIARSMRIDTDAVIQAYSNKKTVDYKSEKIELFEQIVPESGRIEELFDNTETEEDTTERNEDGPKKITTTDDISE